MRESATNRREGRELALQFLFQCDLNPQALEQGLEQFWIERSVKVEAARQFAEELIRGVDANRATIDDTLRRHAENWEVDRMGAVDRNVLRVAIFELLYRPDIPPVVSINEAVDIAKDFSGRTSGKFVNGILDELRKQLTRPARTAGRAEAEDEQE